MDRGKCEICGAEGDLNSCMLCDRKVCSMCFIASKVICKGCKEAGDCDLGGRVSVDGGY